MASKSKTSFCIDSLLARQDVKLTGPPTGGVVHHNTTTDEDSPPSISSGSPPDSSTESGSPAVVRFRSNLFGGILHNHHSYPPPPLLPVDEVKPETDGRPRSNNSDKEDSSNGLVSKDGHHQLPATSLPCWQQPHSITRMTFGSPTQQSSSPSSSTANSQHCGTATYSSPLFTSPAAALHAAAAAAAAAVAASSPSAHQFHSAHLEWLARAGVLYHRFGADLSGAFLFY